MTAIAFTDPQTRNASFFISAKGDFKMKMLKRNIIAAALSLAVAVFGAAPAFADTASSKATARLAEYAQHMTTLEGIKSEAESFNVKNSYCKKTHAGDKSADERALKAIADRANAEIRSLSNIRRILINTVTRVQTARTALDQALPDGSGSIVDGSFFKAFNSLRNQTRTAIRSKTSELANAPTRSCNRTSAPAAAARPAIVVSNYLAEITTDISFADVEVPTSFPEKFCHQDEKDQLLYHLRELRFDARQNAVKAGNLETSLREKLADLFTARDRAFRAADAAAKAGGGDALKTATDAYNQAKADAADGKAKLPAMIKKAEADKKRWRGVVDAIDAQIEKVKAIPVVDCALETPATDPLSGTAFPGVYQHVDNISLKEYNEINIDIAKTCFEKVKQSYVMRASMELSNAMANLSAWSERLHQVGSHHDLLSHDAKASAELVEKMRKARIEARNEVAKWTKIVAQAEAIKAKAEAIVVEDCSGAGGKTEIGRLDPGFGEISSEICTPNLQAYDLPNVPEKICTWEELQALIARAAKAREVAAHNRSEWGKRLNDLGKLLFHGQPGSAYPLRPEYAAHIDAQAQYDYWSAQQDVAHKVYFELRDRKVDDCSQPEKKVSMGALDNAINNRPVFNGGQRSDYGPIGDGYPPVYGYPDFDKIDLNRRITGQSGFDGSEAERALHNTLRNVEPAHQHGPGCGHNGQDNNATGRDYPQTETPKTETQPRDPRTGADTDKRDLPSETRSGSNGSFSDTSGFKLETPEVEYRNGSEDTTPRKLPGIPKYSNINLPAPNREQQLELESLPLKGPQFESRIEENISGQTQPQSYQRPGGCGGGWVQVAPPTLVVPGGAKDYSAEEAAALLEARGN